MMPILSQSKHLAKNIYLNNPIISSALRTPKSLPPKMLRKSLNFSSLINNYSPRYSFSDPKYPSFKQGQKRKIYITPINSSYSPSSGKLIMDIQAFLHTTLTPSNLRILREYQKLQGFINHQQMTSQIMHLRKYIFDVKYEQIKKLSVQQLFEVCQGIEQNYSLTPKLFKGDRLIKQTDFDNHHCQLAILTYFAQFFFLTRLLQKVSNLPQNLQMFNKLVYRFTFIALSTNKQYQLNIISPLQKDSIFYDSEERFKYLVKEQVVRRIGEMQKNVQNSQSNHRFNLKQSALLEEGILATILNFNWSDIFSANSVKNFDQILSRAKPSNLSPQEIATYQNGIKTIKYLKQNKIKLRQTAIVLLARKLFVGKPTIETALLFTGNGPAPSDIFEEYFDTNNSNDNQQSMIGGDGDFDSID